MDATKKTKHPHYRAFLSQKSHAKQRGVEWRLTFDQWLEWWGDDIYQRGSGAMSLQMQRFHDKGAYELGNIVKGHPKQNSRTCGNVKRTRNTERAAREREQRLDALMWEPSLEPDDSLWDDDEDDVLPDGYQSPTSYLGKFAIDKKR